MSVVIHIGNDIIEHFHVNNVRQFTSHCNLTEHKHYSLRFAIRETQLNRIITHKMKYRTCHLYLLINWNIS
jgi:hypothetical protein